ncbi:spore coat protein SA [Devosia crocina]|uniref:Spore coat protein SA n=1 Tax=Devosia crocina TaxID=429728 RepID=A0A1I7NRJ6_9HYPH|nr:glycosyltransferase family 4 protein [Devosia crocina]SFV37222.1 spore coat protein SA [Devosia crocina]
MSASPRRIGILMPEMLPMPPVKGGAVEYWVHRLVQEWEPKGSELTIISRPADVEGVGGVRYIGMKWHWHEKTADRLKQLAHAGSLRRSLFKAVSSLSYSLRAQRVARDFDTLIIENDPVALMFLRKRRGQRVVLHMHNEHLTARGPVSQYDRALEKADRVVFVSDYVRAEAAAAFPRHAARFVTVHNGTDAVPAVSGTDEARPFVLFAGRLVEEKGPHLLLEAFTQIAAEFPVVDLRIAGSSFFADAPRTAYEEKIRSLAGALGERVTFTGFLDRPRLEALYAQAEAVVVPSVWQEPFALTVVEGMAAGRAVIASRVGGIPEILRHEETGLLITPDAASLASALRRVLGDAGLRQRLGQAARAEVEQRFSWDRVIREFSTAVEGDGA